MDLNQIYNQEAQQLQQSNSDESYNKMMQPGRKKCETLKSLRRKIADANSIPFHTEECRYSGPCQGACPKCDYEVRYLKEELQKKKYRGESIVLRGIGKEEIVAYVKSAHSAKTSKQVFKSRVEPVIDYPTMGAITTEDYDIVQGKEIITEMNIDELGFSVRSYNCLKRAGINTVDELCDRSFNELRQIRKLSAENCVEILTKLRKIGRFLRNDSSNDIESDFENDKDLVFHVTNINRLRIGTDGEGIRTLIVTHDCSLRCMYCINPNTWNNEKFRELTAIQLYDEISLDSPYYAATEGGITFGGGEPLQYAEAIRLFRSLCEEEFSIFAETSLHVPREKVEIAASCVDGFIVDIKTTDPYVYSAYTGGNYDLVIENLKYLLETVGSNRITVRVPYIPGFTTQEDQMQSSDVLKKMGVEHIELFDYIII